MKNLVMILSTLTLVNNPIIANADLDHSSSHSHKENTNTHEHKQHVKNKTHDDHSAHAENNEHDEKENHQHSENDSHGEEEAGHDHGSSKAIGKGKAIELVDEEKGFKLSKEAIKTLKLKLESFNSNQINITKNTLVSSKNTKGIYRYREGFFKLINIKIIKETKKGYTIEIKGMNFGDQFVVKGTGLLRVSDIYSTDKAEYGHSH